MGSVLLTITSSASGDAFHAEIALTIGAATLLATIDFAQPVSPEAASEMRWLLEDRPRLRSRAAEEITRRIEARLRQVGERFGEALFAGREGRAILDSLPADRSAIDVRIVQDASAATLPWELLRLPAANSALACETRSFVRWYGDRTAVVGGSEGGRDESVLRVLLVVSRPGGETDVPFRSVASRVVAAVSVPESPIRVDILRPPTFTGLTCRLGRAKASGPPYDLVHFDGHGIFRASPFSPKVKFGALRFETDDGNGENISGKAFGQALLASGVRVAILNACRSGYAEGTPATPFASLAADIIAQGVDGVMAMGFDVYVATAAAIVADAYAALAAGRTLGEAVTFARKRLASTRDDMDWIVPVAYERAPVRVLRSTDVIRTVRVEANAATPAGPAFVDMTGADGPRSARRPFVGYDWATLALDRALSRNHIVEIVGVAGSGKSAVAAETARWIALTREQRGDGGAALPVLVVDVARCADTAAFEAAIHRAIAALPVPLATEPRVWVLDDADTLLAPERRLSDAERDVLLAMVRDFATSGSDVLLTGRATALIEGITSVTLSGLDAAAAADLMSAYDVQPTEDDDVLAAWLDWTQGLPGSLLAPPPFLAGDGNGNGDNELASLRGGIQDIRVGGDKTAQPLATACRLEKLLWPNFSETTVMALFNFQGYLTRELWEPFAKYLNFKTNGLLGGERYDWATVQEDMRGAMRGGFISSLNDSTFFLHPLATFAVTPHYFEMCRAMAGPNPSDRHRRWTLALPISAFCTSLKVAHSLAKLGTLPATMKARLLRQNLFAAAAHIIDNKWWDSASLLREASHALREEQRDVEASQLLAQIETALAADPPTAEQSTVEDPMRFITQLRAEEARYNGNIQQAKNLSAERDALAYAERGKHLVADGKDEMDLGAIQVIALLVRRSEQLCAANDPAALDALLRALRIAQERGDILRTGEIQLEIARVYTNVDALRDPASYEAYARQAVETAEQIEVLAPDLLPRAKASLGTAIVQQLSARTIKAHADRAAEARAALLLAAARGDRKTRAIAFNSLGVLEKAEGNDQAAIDAALRAAELFAAVSAPESVTAYRNAALGLLQMDRFTDAVATAEEGLRIAGAGNIHGESVDVLQGIAEQASAALQNEGDPSA